MSQGDKTRKVLDLLLTGYSKWVVAVECCRSRDCAVLHAVRALDWLARAAAEAEVEVPREIGMLPERLDGCLDRDGDLVDECLTLLERDLQDFILTVLERVVKR